MKVALRDASRSLSENAILLRQTICRHLRRSRPKQSRPPHHLGGSHKHGATYSSHRAPSTYSLGRSVSWRGWDGRV
jgi:hypothetical protein